MMADVRALVNDSPWFQYGSGDQGAGYLATPCVYASATSFTIAGVNVTAAYHTGRRVRAVGVSTGTIYGTIVSASFSTNTTVNVVWDDDSLSNETLTVSLSQLPVIGGPIPFPWIDARSFGVLGDGTTDDGPALQSWLDAIPSGGTGFLPASLGSYYKCGADLTKSGYLNIVGAGVGSRIHYTGSGIALSLGSGATDGPRFSKLHNLYLTGTSSAGGGLYVQEAQEGLFLDQVFIDSFSGAGAYAMRMSASWDVTILGGHLKSSGYGLLADAATVNGISVNNNVTILGCDMSGNTTGLDFASGDGLLVAGCDFSSCTTGIELGRATSSPSAVSNVTIISNYFECTNCIYLGRGAYGTGAVSYIDIQKNYLAGVTDCIHLYECDSVTVGAQIMSGTNTIDSPVTGTCWNSENSLTDNSASGQTARLQGNAKGLISAANITATSIFKLPVYTVATLPAAIAGTKVFVTDATASTFWNVVAGGGSTPIVVTADGTNWRIG